MAARKPVAFDELYPGRFLKSGELRGEKKTFTISDVEVDELEGEKGKKWQGIIYLVELDQQIVLNVTNGLCIKAMFGTSISSWKGKRITLHQDRTQLGGKTVDCIRIWGSPDIDADFVTEIKLPRKKAFNMTMHCTRAAGAASAQPAYPASPTVPDYEACASLAELKQLETRRRAAWPGVAQPDRAPIEAAKDVAKARLMQASGQSETAGTVVAYDEATLLVALQDGGKNRDAPGIEAAWSAIVAHHESINAEIPIDLEAAYKFAKESLEQ